MNISLNLKVIKTEGFDFWSNQNVNLRVKIDPNICMELSRTSKRKNNVALFLVIVKNGSADPSRP